jgi:glutamine synthetase
VDALPGSLGQALQALEQDTVLLISLGAARARAYIAVKQAEWSALREVSLEEEVNMLAERY